MLDGQGTAYDALTTGYISNYTKSVVTSLNKTDDTFILSIINSEIKVRFDGNAKVELYNFSGKLIHSAMVQDEYSKSVNTGVI